MEVEQASPQDAAVAEEQPAWRLVDVAPAAAPVGLAEPRAGDSAELRVGAPGLLPADSALGDYSAVPPEDDFRGDLPALPAADSPVVWPPEPAEAEEPWLQALLVFPRVVVRAGLLERVRVARVWRLQVGRGDSLLVGRGAQAAGRA